MARRPVPELSLSGYSIADLFLQDTLLDGVDRAVVTIAQALRWAIPRRSGSS